MSDLAEHDNGLGRCWCGGDETTSGHTPHEMPDKRLMVETRCGHGYWWRQCGVPTESGSCPGGTKQAASRSDIRAAAESLGFLVVDREDAEMYEFIDWQDSGPGIIEVEHPGRYYVVPVEEET